MLFGRLLERRDTTYQQVWGSDRDSDASPLAAGRQVTRAQALGLSAVFACVRLITDTVSTLPYKRYRRDGAARRELDPPDWMLRPVPRDPSLTWEVHLQQVVTSLLLDGNAFVLVSPDVMRPAELRVLDPRTVETRRLPDSSVEYTVRDHRGGLAGTFDWTQMLHVPLIRLAGELRGVSPLEAERLMFLASMEAEQLARRFLTSGTWLSAVLELPPTAQVDDVTADRIIDSIERKWSGTRNSGRVGLLTGGAKLTQLSVTPEQAQFLETRQYDDERIFRVFRCPPALVGMTREGATSYAASVMQADSYEKHTVRPVLTLLEGGYGQLLPPGEYIRANTADLLRADLLTRVNAHGSALDHKWKTVDEVRATEDMDPLGGAEGGLLQTPNNNAPGGAPAEDIAA